MDDVYYRLKVGEMAKFYGTLLYHRVPPNTSDRTRVSLDFRVAPALCRDQNWQMPNKNLRIIHEWKTFNYEVPHEEYS